MLSLSHICSFGFIFCFCVSIYRILDIILIMEKYVFLFARAARTKYANSVA